MEDSLRALAPRGERNPLPAICDVSVTNVCNAACDFCGFARDKTLVGPRQYIDLAEFSRALPILRRRRIRYMTFQGGEPLVHPDIVALGFPRFQGAASENKVQISFDLCLAGFCLATLSAAIVAARPQAQTISITLAGQSMIRSDTRATAPAAVLPITVAAEGRCDLHQRRSGGGREG